MIRNAQASVGDQAGWIVLSLTFGHVTLTHLLVTKQGWIVLSLPFGFLEERPRSLSPTLFD